MTPPPGRGKPDDTPGRGGGDAPEPSTLDDAEPTGPGNSGTPGRPPDTPGRRPAPPPAEPPSEDEPSPESFPEEFDPGAARSLELRDAIGEFIATYGPGPFPSEQQETLHYALIDGAAAVDWSLDVIWTEVEAGQIIPTIIVLGDTRVTSP